MMRDMRLLLLQSKTLCAALLGVCGALCSCAGHMPPAALQEFLQKIPVERGIGANSEDVQIRRLHSALTRAWAGDCTAATSVLAATPAPPLVDLIHLGAATCLTRRGAWQQALKHVDRCRDTMPAGSAFTAEADFLHLYLQMKTNTLDTTAPFELPAIQTPSEEQLQQARELFALFAAPPSTSEKTAAGKKLLLMLFAHLDEERFRALPQARQLSQQWSRDATFVEAYARILQRKKDYPKALRAFARTYRMNRNWGLLKRMATLNKILGNRSEQERLLKLRVSTARNRHQKQLATIQLGRHYWNRSHDQRAAAAFRRVIRLDPRSNLAISANYFLGLLLASKGKPDEAMKTLANALDIPPQGDLFIRRRLQALFRVGWVALQQGDLFKALKWFEITYNEDVYNSRRYETLFWIGTIYALMNEKTQTELTFTKLAREYPFTYYGLLARKRIATTNRVQLPRITYHPNPAAPATNGLPWVTEEALQRFSPQQQELIRRFDLLAVAGFTDLAATELDQIRWRGRTSQQLYHLANWFTQTGYHHKAMRIARLAINYQEYNPPRAWLRFLYPRAYWEAIQDQSAKHNLDPFFVLALVRQESEFNPRVVSRADAYGLMQIIPPLARRIAKNLEEPLDEAGRLFDPEFNLRVGTYHLQELSRKYDGNKVFMLAAYNASEKAANLWRKRFADLDLTHFIEEIPYGETKLYVKLILRNLALYHALYEGPSALAALP